MYGEMAGDPHIIPVLMGLGMDELSMSASSILNAKKTVIGCSYEKLKANIEKVLGAGSAEEVRKAIEEYFVNN